MQLPRVQAEGSLIYQKSFCVHLTTSYAIITLRHFSSVYFLSEFVCLYVYGSVYLFAYLFVIKITAKHNARLIYKTWDDQSVWHEKKSD